MTPAQEALRDNLQHYLSQQYGRPVEITGAKPLAGGASRDTWYFSIVVDGETHELVLRRDLPSQMFEDALSRKQEFHMMDAAYRQGVKVAKVRWLHEDDNGSDFFIMDYVPGMSIGRRIITRDEFSEARKVLPFHMAEELAKIHSIDFNQPELAFLRRPPEGHTAAEDSIAMMYAVLDDIGIENPVWEWALRRVQNTIPEPNELTFIHGDFRIGNILVDDKGLTAVIDWEFAHIGDPDEELGYLCMRDWRFGAGTKRAAGLTDRETFLKAYEDASGRTVNRASVDWWELMGNIRWGIMCMSQANRHLSPDSEEQSVELASLGRRSAEMQLESLRLIESYGLFD